MREAWIKFVRTHCYTVKYTLLITTFQRIIYIVVIVYSEQRECCKMAENNE